MNVAVGSATDTGRVRQANEDSYLTEPPLFAVADGMGGHVAGDVASSTAVETIKTMAQETPPSDDGSLSLYLKKANAEIHNRAKADPQLSGMGTTCTLLYLDGTTAHVAHVGDSRAYLLRNGEISQITEDHTLVERMVREGRLDRSEASNHPQRSVITRALGIDGDVEVDEVTIEVLEGDRLLLCSDGLTSMIEPEQVREVLISSPQAQQAAERLIEEANLAGGEDNITVVLLDIGSGDQPPPPPAPRQDTAPRPESYEDHDRSGGGRRWLRFLLVTVFLVGVLVGGGYFALRTVLNNSFYVGTGDDGTVTVFRGRPEEVMGFTFQEVERTSDISVDDLEEFRQDDIRTGIKTDSLAAAEEILDSLQDAIEQKEAAERRVKRLEQQEDRKDDGK